MVDPDVSTHDAAAAVLSLSLALLPHPVSTRAAAAATLPAAMTDLVAPLVRAGRRSRIYCLSIDFACRECRIGTLELAGFCGISVCDEQINLLVDRYWSAVRPGRRGADVAVVTIG